MQSKIQNLKSKISLCSSVFSVVRIFSVAALCLLCSGCANQPPNQNALSGIRLRVTMRYNYTVNPNFQYYFCINNMGSINAAGPIPVGAPLANQTYGNGFATASDNGASSATNKGGFTDFVVWGNTIYGGQQQNGYALYHVVGDANNYQNFRSSGVPISSVAPSTDPTDPAGSSTLTFELDLSQLIRDATGGAVDANTAANTARALRYLQVNIIATNATPLTPSSAIKAYDSMGDTSNGRGSYLTLDVTQTGRTVTSTDPTLPETNEPTFYDVYGGSGLSPLDLTSWSIEVVRTN